MRTSRKYFFDDCDIVIVAFFCQMCTHYIAWKEQQCMKIVRVHGLKVLREGMCHDQVVIQDAQEDYNEVNAID